MTPALIDARYISGYRLRLAFADDVEGEIDLESELWGPVFEPLRDLDLFKHFTLNRELNTIEWSTGADFAPEFLYESVRRRQSAA